MTWCMYGELLGAYRTDIPLLGSPGIPLHAPEPYGYLTSHLDGEEGALGGHRGVTCISCRYLSFRREVVCIF